MIWHHFWPFLLILQSKIPIPSKQTVSISKYHFVHNFETRNLKIGVIFEIQIHCHVIMTHKTNFISHSVFNWGPIRGGQNILYQILRGIWKLYWFIMSKVNFERNYDVIMTSFLAIFCYFVAIFKFWHHYQITMTSSGHHVLLFLILKKKKLIPF